MAITRGGPNHGRQKRTTSPEHTHTPSYWLLAAFVLDIGSLLIDYKGPVR